MKTRSILLGVTTIAAGCFAVTATADIENSAHDFSPFGWSRGEICLPCHTPHKANIDVVDAPLWNHEITVASYDTYTSGAAVPFDQALDSRSILCMSCHDGTVALDAFGGNSGTPGNTIGPAGLLGTDLTDDHPVGADAIYPLVPWMNDPVNWESSHGMHIVDGKPVVSQFAVDDQPLYVSVVDTLDVVVSVQQGYEGQRVRLCSGIGVGAQQELIGKLPAGIQAGRRELPSSSG